jgi:predicted CoA-substrate-specific enzyme activase
MITCGVDIGSRSIEVGLYDGAQIIEMSIVDTGAAPNENAMKAFNDLLNTSGVSRDSISRILATGYGRNYFEGADRVASEILCHAAGVAYHFPSVHTVIDIGGQDSKMMQVGEDGKVLNFVMNDRCAAGTGKFIEMMAKTLNVPLEDTGDTALQTTETCEISSMCAVFAESEIIGLLHKGISRNIILRGVFKSIARRILGMAGKVGLQDDVVLTGGVALNKGVIESLKHETGSDIKVPADPQVTGALGAAIIAFRECDK